MSEPNLCKLCGEPMPEGEEMFFYHGYSGPCPKPPLPIIEEQAGAAWNSWSAARGANWSEWERRLFTEGFKAAKAG